jgi:putative SOS response-associated peptidase YedK
MCNLYRLEKGPEAIRKAFEQASLVFPEGIPNFQPRDIRITDRAPIVRAAGNDQGFALVERRWSWPGPTGKPVYNFRSEGREFPVGRCLIVADGFYEYTAPADPKQKRKDRWLFTRPGEDWFAIAGIVRVAPEIGEAFTMLTTEPGPDVALYHSRQIVVLTREDWSRWLDPAIPAGDVLRPPPAGSLAVEKAA